MCSDVHSITLIHVDYFTFCYSILYLFIADNVNEGSQVKLATHMDKKGRNC